MENRIMESDTVASGRIKYKNKQGYEAVKPHTLSF